MLASRQATLKHAWEHQLYRTIFNLSLAESVIPTCFKQTTKFHVAKKAKVTCLNDYHPVALTSVAMKCFERLVMAYINTIMPETLDPLQFLFHPNRSTDDAISISFKHCPFPPLYLAHVTNQIWFETALALGLEPVLWSDDIKIELFGNAQTKDLRDLEGFCMEDCSKLHPNVFSNLI